MAEFRRLPTQQELQQMLFMQGIQPQSNADILAQNLQSQTIKPIPENVFQKMAGGAKTAGEFVNRIGTAADVAKLFPGYTGQSQVNIPTGFNFGAKQDSMGGVIPQGLQTQQVKVGQLLKAIKPADVLGITGAQQAYTDVGMGNAPNLLDVVDIAALGYMPAKAAMSGAKIGKAVFNAVKGLPVGMSIKDAPGLLQSVPKSDIGFYSAVEQAAMASPRKQAPGQAFLNDIIKGGGKADEIKWMGLDDFLKGKQNVTKQEVQDFIANNRVDVEEVKSTIPRLPGEEMPGDQGAFLPKFGSYTLPGGENYRELLLTMPTVPKSFNKISDVINQKIDALADQGINLADLPDTDVRRIEIDKLAQEREKIPFKESYKSSHFPDQPNILAHLRVNDRVDADGKKMLLIEEVQSDWHQAGRDKGYGNKTAYQINDKDGGWYNSTTDKDFAEKQALEIGGSVQKYQLKGIPDAPMKETWYQLALKRAIQVAAEQGYDRIGLTTGSRQAERFDLSKQVNEIVVPMVNPDGGRSVRIDPTGGTSIKLMVDKDGIVTGYGSGSTQFSGKKLNEVIGKEMADKVMKADADARFSGIDLSVGGEGMKKYYDEIYPKFLDKYGKKWGARVGETNLDVVGKMSADPEVSKHPQYTQMLSEELGGKNPLDVSDNDFWKAYAKVSEKITGKKAGETVRYIDITPEMKAGVAKGQPLFQVGIGATGGLLGAQQDQRK
jgi:hypothetical protein